MDRLRRLGVSIDAILAGLTYVHRMGRRSAREWEDAGRIGLWRCRDRRGNRRIGGNGTRREFKFRRRGLGEIDGASIVRRIYSGNCRRPPPLSGNRVLGAITKKAALTGASYRVVATAPMVAGGVGVIDLYVVKDRASAVRKQSAARGKDGSQHAAQDHLRRHRRTQDRRHDRPSGVRSGRRGHRQRRPRAVRRRPARPDPRAAVPPRRAGTVAAIAERTGEVGGGKSSVSLAQIRWLIGNGYLAVEPGPRTATIHRSIRPYRATETTE